jgi:hypothetical protein
MGSLWLLLLIGVLLTVMLFYFGILYSKGGKLTFSFIFFPYTSILGFLFPRESGGLSIALGYSIFFLQYPLYSIILGVGYSRGKFVNWLLLLLGSHILLSVICFPLYRQRRFNHKS